MSGLIAKFRDWKVTIGGQQKTIKVLATDSPDSIGGGGGCQLFAIVGRVGGNGTAPVLNADYVACAPVLQVLYDTGNQILYAVLDNNNITAVAKHMNMRRSISTEWIDGAKLTYTNSTGLIDADNARVSQDPSTNFQAEFAYPRYYTVTELTTAGLTIGGNLPIWSQCFIVAQMTQPSAGAGTGTIPPPGGSNPPPVFWQEVSPTRVWCAM